MRETPKEKRRIGSRLETSQSKSDKLTSISTVKRHILASMMAKESKEVPVKAVLIQMKEKEGICFICREKTNVLRFHIFVYTEGETPRELEENLFFMDYCLKCLMAIFGITRQTEGIEYV